MVLKQSLKEAEARQRQLAIQVKSEDTSLWYSNRRVGERCAALKTIIETPTGRILGAHLLGAHAEEIINLFAVAIRLGITAADLKHVLYAYPTGGSDVPYMV